MKCPKCGSYIYEGQTFCRVCATPVGKDSNGLYRAKPETKPLVKQEEKFSLKKELNVVKSIITDAPLKTDNEHLENKDLIKKDANDRKKATIINFVELGVILVVFWIVIKIILNLLSKL